MANTEGLFSQLAGGLYVLSARKAPRLHTDICWCGYESWYYVKRNPCLTITGNSALPRQETGLCRLRCFVHVHSAAIAAI